LGSELVEADVDMNDPNYDSDSLENGDVELKTIIPETSDEDIQVGELFYARGDFSRNVKVLLIKTIPHHYNFKTQVHVE
jgi:hypothetical protein